MRALVTGAGGFLGRALVRRLAAEGHEVRALVRPGADAEGLGGSGVELVRGDVTHPASLPAAVAGRDVVFHLAGVRRAPARDEFLRANVEGTRAVLEACLAHAPGLARFVLAGSIAAAGPSRTGRREEEPFEPAEGYGESKAEAERLVLARADRLPVAVGRPPRIMGPGDRENLLFFRIVARGFVVGVAGPPRPLSFVDVDDCAAGFVLLATRPEAVGQAFFLAHPEPTALEGLQEEVARALGVRARTVRFPPALLRAAGSAADVASRVLGRRLPLNRKLVEQVVAPGWTCDVSKARRLLGFEARTPLATSIARAAAWYRERGWL
jgi:nucleoside-diphosphate-sugar epimerase